MTRSNPLDVIGRAHAASNDGDHDAHLDAYAIDATTTTPGNVVGGREAMGDFSRHWMQACPDAEIRIVDQIVDGDTVAEQFVFEGTQTKTLIVAGREVPATQRRLSVCGALFIRVRDDKILSERVYLDEMSALEQLGQDL